MNAVAGGALPELDPEALARAEAALAALSTDYVRWVRADVEALSAALAVLRRAAPHEWDDAVERVRAIAHNIKGQGGTFGYPLLTQLGQVLCGVLKDSPSAGEAVLARVDALAAAMAVIVAQGLSGDGGAPGRELLRGLGIEAHQSPAG